MATENKILIIDDEEEMRLLLNRLLTRHGYECTSVGSADEAREAMSTDKFELALTDVRMPGESGLELLAHILTEFPETAAVMVTGVDDPELVTKALELGAYGYIIKPFKQHEVVINVANSLRRRSLEISERIHREQLESKVLERTAHLRRAVDRMREAQRTRDEFVSNCSHELKTPLTPIIAWADILQRRTVPEDKVKEFAGIIGAQSRRLLGVVDSLLRVASISRNEIRARMAPIEVRSFLESASIILAKQGRSVDILVHPDAEWAIGDGAYTDEIIRRLIDNILKFTPEGSSVELRGDLEEGEIVISISDRGSGIPEEAREEVFKPFTQADGSSTRQFGGLGTGLYICSELVSAQGGRIWAEENLSGGANLRFTLPADEGFDQLSMDAAGAAIPMLRHLRIVPNHREAASPAA